MSVVHTNSRYIHILFYDIKYKSNTIPSVFLSICLQGHVFTGIVYPQYFCCCWKYTYHQAMQDVDEFVSSSEQIWRNVHHLLTN